MSAPTERSELRRLVADFGREAARQERSWNAAKRDREWYEAIVWRAAQEKVRKALRRLDSLSPSR